MPVIVNRVDPSPHTTKNPRHRADVRFFRFELICAARSVVDRAFAALLDRQQSERENVSV
jgi:hypothetical protein